MAAPQGHGGMCLKFMDSASEVLFVLILSLNGKREFEENPKCHRLLTSCPCVLCSFLRVHLYPNYSKTVRKTQMHCRKKC